MAVLLEKITADQFRVCYFNGEVTCNFQATATVTYAGGLVGRLSAGSIDYSFSNGIVRANTPSNQGTGGFVGHQRRNRNKQFIFFMQC